MAVAVGSTQAVDSDTVTYTAAAGSNRLVVITLHAEDTSVAWNPTFGGVSFVDAGTDPFSGISGSDIYVGYILEANIPSGSQSVAMTSTGTSWTPLWGGAIYTLTGCDQSTLPNPAIAEDNHTTAATSHTTSSVTSVTDGILICGWTNPYGVQTDTITGYTTLNADHGSGGGWTSGYKLISSGGSETATIDHGLNSHQGVSALLGFAFGAAAGTTIEVPTGPWR